MLHQGEEKEEKSQPKDAIIVNIVLKLHLGVECRMLLCYNNKACEKRRTNYHTHAVSSADGATLLVLTPARVVEKPKEDMKNVSYQYQAAA